MRLLNTKTLQLRQFMAGEIPPYAILSHRWGSDEVMFQDMVLERYHTLQGFAKVESFCQVAAKNGFEYCWIDTCCIDQSSSSELSEAINSMFQWYKRATICYAYLEDVDHQEDPDSPNSSFRSSQWFTRGFTLQELIAPGIVDFFSSNWTRIGSRYGLTKTISQITSIQTEFLQTGNLTKYCAAQKMGWAAGRKCTRVEDEAYCLLGIFGINMPLLYGEGKNAFQRLQEEILIRSGDYSILAHASEAPVSQVRHFMSQALASSPSSFDKSRHLFYHRRHYDDVDKTQQAKKRATVQATGQATGIEAITVTPQGIRMPMWLIAAPYFPDSIKAAVSATGIRLTNHIYLALLDSGGPTDDSMAAILLAEIKPGIYEKQRLITFRAAGYYMIRKEFLPQAHMKTIVLRHSTIHLPQEWSFDDNHYHMMLQFPILDVSGLRLESWHSSTGHISDPVILDKVVNIKARLSRLEEDPVIFNFSDTVDGSKYKLSVVSVSTTPSIGVKFLKEAQVVPFELPIQSQSLAIEYELDANSTTKDFVGMKNNTTKFTVNTTRRPDGWSVELTLSDRPRARAGAAIAQQQSREANTLPISIINPSLNRTRIGKVSSTNLRTWLGHIATEHYDARYVMLRHQLSEAAYLGNWVTVFARIADGMDIYKESWINAFRMQSISQIDRQSMWTPLHQAAYGNAPPTVVKRMIELGASRTLQTKDGCTALDVARQYSVDELISLLEPSIWTDIGSDLLRILQGHFHNLIRLEIGKFVETAQLYLPSLELLTELREEEDEVWFPIQLDRKAAGYFYRLTSSNELLVTSRNIQGDNEDISYRITENGISWVH